jgi:hypothetical protein
VHDQYATLPNGKLVLIGRRQLDSDSHCVGNSTRLRSNCSSVIWPHQRILTAMPALAKQNIDASLFLGDLSENLGSRLRPVQHFSGKPILFAAVAIVSTFQASAAVTRCGRSQWQRFVRTMNNSSKTLRRDVMLRRKLVDVPATAQSLDQLHTARHLLHAECDHCLLARE